ncbi:alpha-1,4-glucan:maltose-1-phosphate maltosyltransferase [Rarobacter incanus]|uniref:Alpha-1,4-glucan:maltose-1-phosphate maltosyltransferase n=1 Tax=Rarobacter incanus TaxID=153494 RepID=A0A542SRP8_9MICO|nr:alpha-1,4-glucan:maltose-1-phosphate maltosyltransferase [Rarobacter incanus]
MDVQPVIEGGRWATKAVVGEVVPVSATVFREGHDLYRATAVLIDPSGRVHTRAPMREVGTGLDHWAGAVVPDAVGDWGLRVEGWSDPYGTWCHNAHIKIPAGIDVELTLAEGAEVLRRAAAQASRTKDDATTLAQAAATAVDASLSIASRFAAATSAPVTGILDREPLRELVSGSPTYPLRVDREAALCASWYEFFPRSEGAYQDPDGNWHSGTFETATGRLPAIAAMGFDTVYLTPIHPIGTTERKGRNNTLGARPGDPGSPYAIGSHEGGHADIHPELGDEADFAAFVAAARSHGLEVAIDLALQCSPDHPWVKEHPQWFTTLPDGSIAYAENPPKKYQDIYPLNFDNDPEGIYQEIARILRVWIARGVTAFRVDNPHTKPLPFWERLLGDIRSTNPEVLFLAEAFTRPAMMKTLATIGFHQSYSYFTWRNTKWELEEYFSQIADEQAGVMRPSFWPTTHDILPPYLQNGGIAGFKVRAILAAMSSPLWGIYSGYELVENVPRPGVEEQIDNEKYEFKPRNWSLAQHYGIADLLTRLNGIKRNHPALRQLRNLRVHPTTSDDLVAFSHHLDAAYTPSHVADTVLTVVNLDPHGAREGIVHLDLGAIGLGDLGNGTVTAYDELSGETYQWGAQPFVRLDPAEKVAHVVHLRRN